MRRCIMHVCWPDSSRNRKQARPSGRVAGRRLCTDRDRSSQRRVGCIRRGGRELRRGYNGRVVVRGILVLEMRVVTCAGGQAGNAEVLRASAADGLITRPDRRRSSVVVARLNLRRARSRSRCADDAIQRAVAFVGRDVAGSGRRADRSDGSR